MMMSNNGTQMVGAQRDLHRMIEGWDIENTVLINAVFRLERFTELREFTYLGKHFRYRRSQGFAIKILCIRDSGCSR